MNFWGVSNRPTEILDSLLLMSVVGSISCSAAAAGWVHVTRQASVLMTACACIWIWKSQAQSHGRQSRAEQWLTALHHSQWGFLDSYSGSKTKLIFSYCGEYLDNNTDLPWSHDYCWILHCTECTWYKGSENVLSLSWHAFGEGLVWFFGPWHIR